MGIGTVLHDTNGGLSYRMDGNHLLNYRLDNKIIHLWAIERMRLPGWDAAMGRIKTDPSGVTLGRARLNYDLHDGRCEIGHEGSDYWYNFFVNVRHLFWTEELAPLIPEEYLNYDEGINFAEGRNMIADAWFESRQPLA